jgi:N-acylglucosamine-6-phosphate 2-epimerase
MDIISNLKDGLIVSCQAYEDSPLYGTIYMIAMAKAAEKAGACGLRIRSYKDIFAVRKNTSLPIIGLTKTYYSDSDVYITPTFKEAKEVYDAGADILCLDCTQRKRPGGLKIEELVMLIKKDLNIPIMADISTLEEGLLAENMEVDFIATTLSGYTPYSKKTEYPDFELVQQLTSRIKIPVIMEGKISTPEEAVKALKVGAFAVVIGSAITNPEWITRRFIKSIKKQ